MKVNQTWKSIETTDDGVHSLLKLCRYLGSDHWLIEEYLSDESIKCANAEIMRGSYIYKNYKKVSDD